MAMETHVNLCMKHIDCVNCSDSCATIWNWDIVLKTIDYLCLKCFRVYTLPMLEVLNKNGKERLD